jgi:hypothetical protein
VPGGNQRNGKKQGRETQCNRFQDRVLQRGE